jgi:hypothetical protein
LFGHFAISYPTQKIFGVKLPQVAQCLIVELLMEAPNFVPEETQNLQVLTI